MKKQLLTLALCIMATGTFAQSATLSPYSMYGLGVVADQANGAGRGMGGVGQGFRDGNQINNLNPASYSSIDSLTFIFDIGMSLRSTQFKENGIKKTAKTGDFEYLVAGFRAAKHVGVGFGILPYSNVGYNFSGSPKFQQGQFPQYPSAEPTTIATQYYGDGGIHEIFLGGGWEPVSNLSVGVNVSYLWGDITRQITTTFSNASVNSHSKIYQVSAHNYKLTFGAQYSLPISRKDLLTIGASYTPGHTLCDGELLDIDINSKSGTNDTITSVAHDGYRIPTTVAVGLAYRHAQKWKVGLDYTLQNWSNIGNTRYVSDTDGSLMSESTGSYTNRHKIAMGGEWCKNIMGRSIFDKIRYRAGFSYTTSYLKINGQNGPQELSATVGVGVPIINAYNNRSILNIGFQWINQSRSLINENSFCINIGLTFNERWFAKWKFD